MPEPSENSKEIGVAMVSGEVREECRADLLTKIDAIRQANYRLKVAVQEFAPYLTEACQEAIEAMNKFSEAVAKLRMKV